MLKRLAVFLILGLVVFAAVLVFRTLQLRPEKVDVAPAQPVTVDAGAVGRFAGAVRIRTISSFGQPIDAAAMQQFRDFLQTSFPRVHAAMRREVLASGSLLFTWEGRDPLADPVILMGHIDVVPVEQATLGQWKHDPFSGDVADGAVWGRGTLDDKASVLSLMEAAETLLSAGFTPARTVLFAFGDDEENGGAQGAKGIVQLLASRGVHAQLVVDEGGAVLRGAVSGLEAPLSIIGIAEKGFASLRLSTNGKGGHSSEPPPHTAIGQLAEGITRLEADPFPASITDPMRQQLTAVTPYLPFGKRLVLANLWLTAPLVISQTLKAQGQAGGVHTTTAVDMIGGGTKDNVLPTEAHAVVNFRILPGETVATVVDGVRQRVNDAGIAVTVADPGSARNPSPVSPTNAEGFQVLAKTVRQMFPGVIVAPYLVQAATDASHYYVLSPNVYRFAPLELDMSALTMAHGFNEHVSTANYQHMVQVEAQLLRNLR